MSENVISGAKFSVFHQMWHHTVKKSFMDPNSRLSTWNDVIPEISRFRVENLDLSPEIMSYRK